MKRLLQSLFLSIFLLVSLSSTLESGIIKKTAKVGAVYGASKAASSYAKDKAAKALHKNSKDYKGDSHVYSIQNKNGAYKVGESSQGKDKLGNSKRAENQVEKLKRENNDNTYTSTVRKDFNSKAEAREYETKLIERTRSLYGTDKNDKSVLVGNKSNR